MATNASASAVVDSAGAVVGAAGAAVDTTESGLGAAEGLAEDGVAAAADLIWGERRCVCCCFTRLLPNG